MLLGRISPEDIDRKQRLMTGTVKNVMYISIAQEQEISFPSVQLVTPYLRRLRNCTTNRKVAVLFTMTSMEIFNGMKFPVALRPKVGLRI